MLQCVAVCCIVFFESVHLKAKILQCVLQCVAGVLQYVAVCCGMLQMLQCLAVGCIGLQCVAVGCSVL